MLVQLEEGLIALGEDPAEHPCDAYLAYLELLEKWNRSYNLSGIKEKQEMLAYHLLDSLSALAQVKGNRCLDVGSGAGLPGLILALAKRERQWTLLDSNGKKTRFIQQAVMELGIDNVEVVTQRLDDFQPGHLFDTITCRALMPAAEFCASSARLLADEGQMLMLKGPGVDEEIEALKDGAFCTEIIHTSVPGVLGKRCILQVTLAN